MKVNYYLCRRHRGRPRRHPDGSGRRHPRGLDMQNDKEMTIESPGKFWKDYELIDSGNFEKLERFGQYIMARPEPKALWDKTMSDQEWNRVIQRRTAAHGRGSGR